VVRADLPLGDLAAQLVHAAGYSALLAPLPPGTNAVVLSVPGEAELLALEALLRSRGLTFAAVREPDAPFNGALTAIGIAPGPRASLRRLLKRLPLLRGAP
jgi:peptidyl-tRNA hydrolase